MSWWGKIVGGAFGFAVGGPIGAVLGATVGHTFDRGIDGIEQKPPRGGAGGGSWQGGRQNRRERAQIAFFTATFSVMGRLAKVDGRVSEDEIRVAEAIMQQMRLNEEQRKAAVRLFQEGKRAEFDLDGVVAQLRDECRRRPSLIQFFLEIQIEAAYADGEMTPDEEELLHHVCRVLGFPVERFRLIERMLRGQRRAHQSRQQQAAGGGMALEDAYSILGVDSNASRDEVKKAYRRLMSQHHPDKLVSRGLPDEMIDQAKEKSQQISRAYETIRENKGW